MPTDIAVGSSMTFSRNPDYWGYDERHPDNQLPYVDALKHVSIPDTTTALAAIRTGQVDMITDYKGSPSWQQVLSLSESNPEINTRFLPQPGYAIDFRCDHEPFTDIRVRTALQMALDLKTMADTIWGGTAFGGGTPVGLIDPLIEGYVIPYDEWSDELKAEYSYDPEGARALLAEANYPNGFETNIVCSASDNMDFLQAVKSYFMDIGVDMEIQAMEHQSYMSFVADGKQDQMTLAPLRHFFLTNPAAQCPYLEASVELHLSQRYLL
jgi:peptide/nickel transport system substrate-binding protein